MPDMVKAGIVKKIASYYFGHGLHQIVEEISNEFGINKKIVFLYKNEFEIHQYEYKHLKSNY